MTPGGRARAAACGLLALSLAITVAAQDAKEVQIQTLDVRDILYALTGPSNSLALLRDDAVVLIDTKPAGWGRPMLGAIATASDQPVTTIINTHAHPDHVAANTEFPTAARIVAHANARARMAKMEAFGGAAAKFLPNEVVQDRLTLLDGPDRIELYYFGRGHTDGDLVVVFPEKRLAHFGDLFTAKAAPAIDVESGGSAVAIADTLARAVKELPNIARVTSGHDPTAAVMGRSEASLIVSMGRALPWRDLVEFADFNRDFLETVRQAMAAGKTADEAAATLQVPERYQGYDLRQAPANVRAIYRELGK
jgi:glyoxylase-like metal-dependent hydrolase (beta-lactamase superfamily II)